MKTNPQEHAIATVATTSAGAATGAEQQQQEQPVLVPPTAASLLPRWATLEFPLPIVASRQYGSTANTTKEENEEENELLSREEANLRTQTFHSVSLQLDDACQKAMQRLYIVDNENATAASAGKNKRKTSIQQALETLFQETAATACDASSSISTSATAATEKNSTVAISPVTPNDDGDDAKKDASLTTRKRELQTTGDHRDVIEEEEEEEPPKRVRLEETEEQQQRCHLEILRNRFLAAVASSTTTTTATTSTSTTNTSQEKEQQHVNKCVINSLLLPVLLMQGPYHAMDRFMWMQFLVEQSRSRRRQGQFCPQATCTASTIPSPPPPAVVWLRPAAGLATSWPEEILRQLLLLLQSTANDDTMTNNPTRAAQAQLAYAACCHCPLTGRPKRQRQKSHFVGRILQTWARHVEGLFSGIVIYVDVLDTLASSSSSNINTGSGNSTAYADNSSSSSSSSSSLDWKDLLSWLSHQRAGHGLPVSCVVMVPATPSTNGQHGLLLSFDSSSSLQGVGAGMNVQKIVLPTTRHFLTTLQECLQEQPGSSSSSDSRLLRLVQQIGSILNQHEHEPDAVQESSSLSSLAAIPVLMDWKRCVAQILTRRSSFLPFWLLQNQHQHQQQQYDLKLHVSWFLRHTRGRDFLLHDSSNKNSLVPLEKVGILSCSSSNNIPLDDMHNNKNDQTPHLLWQWLQQSRQWHLLVEMARSIEQAATCRQTTATSTTTEPPLLLLLPVSNPNEQHDQPLEYNNRRAILAILFRFRQELQQSQPCSNDDKNDKNKDNNISCFESSSADTVDEEHYGQRLSRHLLERPFANDEITCRRILHQVNQLIILVDQCAQVSQVHRLVVAPILEGWSRHLEWLFSSNPSSSSSSTLKSLVQQAQPRRQTTAGLLAQSLGSTTCLPISSLERLPGILYGLISNRVSIPQEEWFYEYFQRLRQYQRQAQEQRYSRQEAFALFCCGTQYLKILGLIKERRRQQRAVAVAASVARAVVPSGGKQAESVTNTVSGIVYDKISLVFCGGNN